MSWLSERWDDPEGHNRAKWKKVREQTAREGNEKGQRLGEQLRSAAERSLETEKLERARNPAPSRFSGRDIMSGAINSALAGAIGLAVIATSQPESHDSIRSGIQNLSNSATEIQQDIGNLVDRFRPDPFAPAFDGQ